MPNYCFFNGKIIPFHSAKLRLNDLGVMRGYGVFDFLHTYNGKPFKLKENLQRIRNSAKIIGLSLVYEDKQLIDIIYQLLDKNKFSESDIRLVLTGGPSDDLITSTAPTFYIMVSEHKNLPEKIYLQGTKLITYEYRRLFPEAKTLNYITAVKLQPKKISAGAIDILYVFQNKILECSTSNFFCFIDKILHTPKKDILNGITRELVIKFAQEKYKVIEREIYLKELEQATEVFITAANKKILPIVKIDDLIIGNGKVGANTLNLMEQFDNYAKNY